MEVAGYGAKVTVSDDLQEGHDQGPASANQNTSEGREAAPASVRAFKRVDLLIYIIL